MIRLETERLLLRSWTLADADDLFAYARLDTVGPNAGWKPHESIAESREIIKNFIAKDDVWAIELKSEHKVIGSVGIHDRNDSAGRKVKELGYVLSTAYEHRGLMTEACRRVLKHLFEDTNIEEVQVRHFRDNQKSQRVIEKLGFVYVTEENHITSDNIPRQSRSYAMSRTQYSANGGKT